MSAPRPSAGGRAPRLVVIAVIAALGPTGCAGQVAPGSSSPPDPQDSFFDHYARYCGASYEGRSVMVDLGDDHPLEGARLRMVLARCTDREVRIPFHVNHDRSRTWIIARAEHGLHLAHDHRYDDGTQHDANFYGGYADDRGSSTKQFFPADDRTIRERPGRAINVWSKEFDLENQRYYYRLYLGDELRYEAEFDLSRPQPIP